MSHPISNRTVQIIALREQGMTYQQIADKVGVSKQYIAQICGKRNPRHFRVITEEGCIYPNLRAWMNDNKVSRRELLRRMGRLAWPVNSQMLSRYLRGEDSPRKEVIDAMLKATGLTYEFMFATETDSGLNTKHFADSLAKGLQDGLTAEPVPEIVAALEKISRRTPNAQTD